MVTGALDGGSGGGAGFAAINIFRLIATPMRKCKSRAAKSANANGKSFLARCLRRLRFIASALPQQFQIESPLDCGPHPEFGSLHHVSHSCRHATPGSDLVSREEAL